MLRPPRCLPLLPKKRSGDCLSNGAPRAPPLLQCMKVTPAWLAAADAVDRLAHRWQLHPGSGSSAIGALHQAKGQRQRHAGGSTCAAAAALRPTKIMVRAAAAGIAAAAASREATRQDRWARRTPPQLHHEVLSRLPTEMWQPPPADSPATAAAAAVRRACQRGSHLDGPHVSALADWLLHCGYAVPPGRVGGVPRGSGSRGGSPPRHLVLHSPPPPTPALVEKTPSPHARWRSCCSTRLR